MQQSLSIEDHVEEAFAAAAAAPFAAADECPFLAYLAPSCGAQAASGSLGACIATGGYCIPVLDRIAAVVGGQFPCCLLWEGLFWRDLQGKSWRA